MRIVHVVEGIFHPQCPGIITRTLRLFPVSTHALKLFLHLAFSSGQEPTTLLPLPRSILRPSPQINISYASQQEVQSEEVNRLHEPPIEAAFDVIESTFFEQRSGDGDDGDADAVARWVFSGTLEKAYHLGGEVTVNQGHLFHLASVIDHE